MTGNPTPPPLGRLLLERGLLTEQELEHALIRSAESGRPLGNVVLELDLVPPNQIADLLAVQRAWRPLGWMLVERGLLTESQLSDCLDVGQATGRRLGEVVLERGLVPPPALEAVLDEQYQREVELERGFGNGLRGEIERRHRLKRAADGTAGDPLEPTAETFAFERPTPVPVSRAAAAQRGDAAQRTSDEADEIRRLRTALAERDATIRALRERLGETDAVAV